MKQSHLHMKTWISLECSSTTSNLRTTSTRMLIIAKLINTCKLMAVAAAHAQKYSPYIQYKKEGLAFHQLW